VREEKTRREEKGKKKKKRIQLKLYLVYTPIVLRIPAKRMPSTFDLYLK